MTLAVVQSKIIAGSGSSVTTENYAFNTNVTTGNTLLMFFFPTYGSTIAFGAADSAARALTALTGINAQGGFAGIYKTRAFYYENHPGGITQLTVTSDLDTFANAVVWLVEVSGNTPVIDKTTGTPNVAVQAQSPAAATTDAVSSGNATPSKANTLGLAFTRDCDSNGGTIAAGTGWTSSATATDVRAETLAISGTSALAATFTHTPSSAHMTAFAIVSETAAAGPRPNASRIGTGGMSDMSGGMQGRSARSRIVVPSNYFKHRPSRGARPDLRI